MSIKMIPFQIETQRVIQLLAKQIYQSPLALLRENTQNAFDAVRQKIHQSGTYQSRIDIRLEPDLVVITDNGIGMTPSDLEQHYWKAGSSSKNNDAARAAGVVGTFGIGAMANFGIADTLVVETESAITKERTRCKAERARLSLKENCIEQEILASQGESGTKITAHVRQDSRINVGQARNYIAEFVSLVDVPVYVNDELVSQRQIEVEVPMIPETWRLEQKTAKIGERLSADICFVLSNNAEIWMKLTNLKWVNRQLAGRILLRSGHAALRAFRSGFGLSTASVNSAYQFGGVVDLLVLEPTAGREAITVDGLQLLQSMMSEIDLFTSTILANRDEADMSTPFMNWVVSHNRYDLCGRLKISVSPGDRITLNDVSVRSQKQPMMFYEGTDQSVIKSHSTEETPLLILARGNPRRRCEQNYLKKHANVTLISNSPTVTNRRSFNQLNLPESGLAYRLDSILDSNYFLKCDIEFGSISHNLPALVEKQSHGLRVTLNPESQSIKLILGLYETEYTAFGSMVIDFVRTLIFPLIADFVPSSTRQGAEAFLKVIRRPREFFEIGADDLGSLSKIWEDQNAGLLTVEQAVERSKSVVRTGVQIVDIHTQASAKEVVPDVVQNEQAFGANDALNPDPAPAITRLEKSTVAKLLVIPDKEPALRGFRCFLAISDKVREEMGEFFLQPHRTSIVWGGQKTLFIFLHHSGQFGLYYDVQTREPIAAPSGGTAYPTATIVLKNRLFIPIPNEIRSNFIPKIGEPKKFDVRADILRTEQSERDPQ